MNAYQLIRKKRDGQELTPVEMKYLIDNFVEGYLPDYQMAAFMMAVFFRGLSEDELNALIKVMMRSGDVLDLSHIPGIKVDKHSTGGVGDKISLILAPLVAAAGVPVPMMSGRGLGHTGGTVDKLESIPGFKTDLSLLEFKQLVEKNKIGMISQTTSIAPADKKMYSLRDVTATVESIPLITASILSKKLAEGADAFVFDVKSGSGAFMASEEDAIKLAQSLTRGVETFNKKSIALITDMNQPLGYAVGNILEVKESIETLLGNGPTDVTDLTVALGAEMLLLAEAVNTFELGCERMRKLISDRSGYLKFLEMVEIQNGDCSFIEDPGKFPTAAHQLNVSAESSGFVHHLDTLQLGLLSVRIGVGRENLEDVIDPTAGFVLHKKVGDFVNSGDTLLTIHTSDRVLADKLVDDFRKAYQMGELRLPVPELIKYRVTPSGVEPWRTPVK